MTDTVDFDRRKVTGILMPRSPNSLSGWSAFRQFRADPEPVVVRRHGNWKHGRYSKQAIADRRMMRHCVRMLNTDLGFQD